MMKNILFVFIIGVFNIHNFAFSQLKDKDRDGLIKVGRTSEKNPITAKRAIFIYRNSDSNILEDFETVLTKSWGITELLLLSKNEFQNFKPENGDIVFSIGTDIESSTTLNIGTEGTSSTTSCYFDLQLRATYYSYKNDSLVSGLFGYSKLHFEQPLALEACSGKKSLNQIVLDLYDSGKIYNWDLTYISNFVGIVSKQIEDSEFKGITMTDESLSNLKTNTLYISDGVNIKGNKFLNKDVLVDNSKMVDRVYKFPHEIVSKEQLDKFAIEGKEGYVLYSMNMRATTKYVILDLKTGKVIYSRSGYKFNVTSKDFKRIVKYINNPNKK